MQDWIRTLVIVSCVLTMLLHVIPDGKYIKYMRFYAGLIFVLLAVQPLLRLFSGNTLEYLLQLALLQEDARELSTAVEGMRELKEASILSACREELTRQLEALACTCGADRAEVEVSFSDPDDVDLTSVSFTIVILDGTAKQYRNTAAAIRAETDAVYGLESQAVRIRDEGGAWL